MPSRGNLEPPLSAQRAVELQKAEEMMRGIMIPPRPSILVEVLNEQARADVDLHRISELISKDVAISAGVLRIVNSAFFGLPRKISSIDHAVRMIGLRSVTNVVTALMLHSAFAENKGRFMDAFWTTSGRLAAATSYLSRLTPDVSTEEGYTLGLFANCGVPLMLRKFPSYPTVYEQSRLVDDVTEAAYEDAELDTDHTLVGYIMGKSWELPESMCQCILRHHDAVDYFSDGQGDLADAVPLLAVLHLGQYVTRAGEDLPASFEWKAVGRQVCAFLDVPESDLPDLERDAAALLAEETGLLGDV